MLVAPDASIDDARLDVAVYPGLNKAELLAYFTKLMNEGQAEDVPIQRYQARRLTIKASPKLQVMADGVMLGKGKVKIKIFPGALRVIAPPVGAGLEKSPQAAGTDLPEPVAPATQPGSTQS